MKKLITLEYDPELLKTYSDEYLAALWHANEHSVADHAEPDSSRIALQLSLEFTRRALKQVGPSLFRRAGLHSVRPAHVFTPGTDHLDQAVS